MKKPSLAEDFFNRIIGAGDGAASARFLRGLINPPTSEADWLDFKGGEIAAENEARIKAIWSAALSAFANTDGGVVVFGLTAKRNQEGVDAAHALSLIPNPAAFKSRLDQLLCGATNPPVQGVDIRHCDDVEELGKGFVVTFIPESAYKPHRAEFANNHYYLRTGTSSNPVSPGTLRHLFYPIIQSRIVPTIQPQIREASARSGYFVAEFGIILGNTGNRTARNLFITMPGVKVSLSYDHTLWREVSGYSAPAFECQRPLHPGGKMPFCQTNYSQIRCKKEGERYKLIEAAVPVAFDLRIFADDQEPIVATVNFGQDEIEQQGPKICAIKQIDC